jgi:uncharacterized protein (TIGR02147 family)
MEAKNHYRRLLQEELECRRLRNPGYSENAFARTLALSSGRLSEILRGKQGLSPQSAERIAARLGYAPAKRRYFVDLVRASHARSRLEREQAQRRLEKFPAPSPYHSLSLDAFRFISEWWHLTILELMKTKGFRSSPKWIASRLAIAESEVVEALLRLRRLGIIGVENQAYVLKEANCSFPGGVANRAGRRFHSQMLKLASRALLEQPLDKREFTTTVIAMDPKRLPYLKQKMAQFWSEVDQELSRDEAPREVYCLGLQLFGLTREEPDA